MAILWCSYSSPLTRLSVVNCERYQAISHHSLLTYSLTHSLTHSHDEPPMYTPYEAPGTRYEDMEATLHCSGSEAQEEDTGE